MDRVIKFRGLRTDGKGWVFGFYAAFTGRHIIYVDWTAYEVIPSSVGQLLATVGEIEIYEGDVLVNPRGTKFTAMIWDNLPCLKENRIDRMMLNPMVQGYLNNKTVVGTIHEESEVHNA